MKICASCVQELPREKFSKKQWQLKQTRRCKECIANNREINLEAPNDAPPTMSSANDEGASQCWSDEELFKQPPPTEECPICMLPLTLLENEKIYYGCCGKTICRGCMHADDTDLCAFCRAPAAKDDGEWIEWLNKRAEGGDADAMYNLGCLYKRGGCGLPRRHRKAMKFWLRAGNLGSPESYCNVGSAYYNGEVGVEDTKKGRYYLELAAMGGNMVARNNLGTIVEVDAGNMNRAMRHLMISAGAGFDDSLKAIRQGYVNGHVTKDDFEKALRAHQASKNEMKSEQRAAAAAL